MVYCHHHWSSQKDFLNSIVSAIEVDSVRVLLSQKDFLNIIVSAIEVDSVRVLICVLI